MTVELIIPTVGHVYNTVHPYNCFSRLHHLPFPIRIHIVTRGKTWAEAINIGLSQTDSKSDVILMDDDVFINESTFANFDRYYDKADIFGFRLLFPNGKVQHAGGAFDGNVVGHIGYMEENDSITKEPYYVCHATTSLIYIKREVIDSLKGMSEDIPGIQFEDVDFNFRAIKEDFKILQLPNEAIHMESATKSKMERFTDRANIAYNEIHRRHLCDNAFKEKLGTYPIQMNELVALA